MAWAWKGRQMETIGDLIGAMGALETPDEAKDFRDAYREADAEVADSNMGWLTGEFDPERGQELRDWLEVGHPVLGRGPAPDLSTREGQEETLVAGARWQGGEKGAQQVAAMLAEAREWKVPPGMDDECIGLCRAMNGVPGIQTVESCCGHGKEPYRVWFKADDLESLPLLLYWFDGCHSGHYGWRVQVRTDCGMSPATFLVEGPSGAEAYEQAEEIAGLLQDAVARVAE